jgi:hypothetical protein
MALQQVSVISHHSHTHTDKHAGIKYDFEPNKTVIIPIAAAVHFFGLGLKDRSIAYKRHGFTSDEKGLAYLKKFEIKVVDLVPEGSDVEEIKEEHAKVIGEKDEAHEKELAELEAEHREEVQRINKLHAAEVQAFKTRIVELVGSAGAGKSQKGK